MQWVPTLVTSAGVVLAMVSLGWQVYSKIDSKIDALREEMQTGFREVNRQFLEVNRQFQEVNRQFREADERFDKRFVEMMTAMGSVSERVAAVEARSERQDKTVDLLQASALGLSTKSEDPDRAEKTQRRAATDPAAAERMPATT